jgi:hypothetical protein
MRASRSSRAAADDHQDRRDIVAGIAAGRRQAGARRGVRSFRQRIGRAAAEGIERRADSRGPASFGVDLGQGFSARGRPPSTPAATTADDAATRAGPTRRAPTPGASAGSGLEVKRRPHRGPA